MSRDSILADVRRAIRGAHDVEPPREYSRSLGADVDLVELFVDRLEDYRAEVRRVSCKDLPGTIGRVLGQRQAQSAVIPPGLDPSWLVTVTCPVLRDDGQLTHAEIEGAGAAITASTVAIAQTGTIVLDGGPLQGRRVISLLPDLHVCVVAEQDIVGSLPEAMSAMTPTAAMTWISGPSATSDIELERVEGVHGPRQLVVLLVS